jgi:hypothetical protein
MQKDWRRDGAGRERSSLIDEEEDEEIMEIDIRKYAGDPKKGYMVRVG